MGHKSTKTVTKVVEKQDQSQENWLAKNPQYQKLVNDAINEAANYKIEDQQLAGLNPDIQNALSQLSQGVDLSGYKNAQDYFTNLGQQYQQQGQQGLSQAQDVLSQYANLSQADYQKMLQSEFNSSLVNDQIKQLTGDVNKNYALQVEGLNQQAGAAGGMGNSRAGVAQANFAEGANKAIAQGSVQYRQAEESQAMNRLNTYMNTRLSTAQTQAGIAQNQISTGLQAYGQGMNYMNQYNNLNIQNQQNRLTAGEYMRNYQQQQMDLAYQNRMSAQSTSLQRLMFVNQGLSPIAGYAQYGTTNTNKNTNSTQSGGGGGLGGIMGAVGMVGGAVAGAYMGNPALGMQLGGAIGGAAGSYM
jgi:hypothetical protein